MRQPSVGPLAPSRSRSTPGAHRTPRPHRTLPLLAAGLSLLVLLAVLGLAIGSRPIPPERVVQVLLHRDGGVESVIVWHLRMPRVLAGVLLGAGLGVGGVVMQALTRNPLAEPGILGVNAGASLAVVLGTSAGLATSNTATTAFALLGAAAAAAAVTAIGNTVRPEGSQRVRLVLAGSALAACLGSVTGTITMVDQSAFAQHRFWVVGSLADRSSAAVWAATPCALAGILLALALARPLDALELGDAHATTLGVPVTRTRALGLLAVTLLAGAATALAGPVAFVGLVVPHVLRRLTGPGTGRLVLLSVVHGPCLVLAADVLGRVLARPSEVEVGVVTALLGAPVLLAMANRGRR